jgi:hypothetical protein
MKEALSSSETSVLTRPTRRNIPEVTILHSHRSENLKSYKEEIGRFLFIEQSRAQMMAVEEGEEEQEKRRKEGGKPVQEGE